MTDQSAADPDRRADRGRRPRPDAPRGRHGWGPPGDRPEWWPADESWPPRRWRRRRRRSGFGCFFGILFAAGVLGLIAIAGSFVGRVLEAPGPAGHVVRIAAFVVIVAALSGLLRGARTLRRSGTTLDALVDQASRVEAGDYGARVTPDEGAPAPVRELARGFNTMAARLEADEAQRRSLLADVTHELRTPLAVVQGSVEAILDGVHPADDAHLGAILEETHVLERLIEDLRTLTLSESGGLSLHREPADLAILVGEVATSFAASAAAAGVAIEAQVDDAIPLLEIDPVRIREVIGNLVANALRHTPSGGRVTIDARPVANGSRPTPRTIEIVVRDTGSGIPADLLPHVFDRFARGAGSPGSGLGLSIARGLVELHGGTITASSAPGSGAVIRIMLPVAAPAS